VYRKRASAKPSSAPAPVPGPYAPLSISGNACRMMNLWNMLSPAATSFISPLLLFLAGAIPLPFWTSCGLLRTVLRRHRGYSLNLMMLMTQETYGIFSFD
jgi:hypothetical protein